MTRTPICVRFGAHDGSYYDCINFFRGRWWFGITVVYGYHCGARFLDIAANALDSAALRKTDARRATIKAIVAIFNKKSRSFHGAAFLYLLCYFNDY